MNNFKYANQFLNHKNEVSGVQVSIASKTLEKILQNFRVKKAMGSCAGGFGDEYWLMVCERYNLRAPQNLEEFKTWLPGFFELYGTAYLAEDERDSKYEYISDLKRKRIVSSIVKNMDKIINDMEGFTIGTLTSNKECDSWSGNRVLYHEGQYQVLDLSEVEAKQFFHDFEAEIMIINMIYI